MTASVRVARISDAEDIVTLTAQLGYEVELVSLRERLRRVLGRPEHQLIVAELEGRTVGWLHAAVWESIEADPFVVIRGLVVDRNHRRQGVGRLLMEHAERWALAQGCHVVRLSSSSVRTEAHRFYEHLGYEKLKVQYSFAKPVGPSHAADLRQFVPRVESEVEPAM